MDDQTLPFHNPAERLYVILTRMAGNHSRGTVRKAFCDAIEMDTNDENFIQGIDESFTLLKNMEEQVEKYFPPRKHKACLQMVKGIRQFISTVVQRNDEEWINLSSRLMFPDLHILNSYVCDFEQISLNKDSLIELINNVENWIKEINESQLDEDIKQFFIHKLMEIKHFLEKYCYHGSSRIKREIYATMVEIGMYQENFTEDKKEENRNFFTAIYKKLSELSKELDLVNKPMTTIVVADKLSEVLPPMLSQTAEIITNVVKHLPPGS